MELPGMLLIAVLAVSLGVVRSESTLEGKRAESFFDKIEHKQIQSDEDLSNISTSYVELDEPAKPKTGMRRCSRNKCCPIYKRCCYGNRFCCRAGRRGMIPAIPC